MMSPARRLSDRHPFEIYLLSFALLTSAPAAVGLARVPGSISDVLEPWQGRVWAVGLTIGCALALVGLSWRRPNYPKVSVTGLALEQTGLTIVGVSTVFYATAVIEAAGWSALIPAGIVVAFGLACFAQAVKIQAVLRTLRPTR